MDKLLLTALSIVFLTTSCFTRPAKDEGKSEAVAQDTTIRAKPKYKSDIKKELEGYFTHRNQGDAEQVIPKGIPSSAEGLYCYFFIKKKKAISLKLHIQIPEYDADLIELHVDGESETYEVNQSYSSKSMLDVAETYSKRWYDKTLNVADEALLRKAATANDVSLVFKKESGAEVGTMNLKKEDCESLVRAIDYYKAHNSAQIPKRGMVNIRG